MDITVEPRGGPTLELDYALSLEAPAGHGECSSYQPSLLICTALIVPGGFCAGPSASANADILEAAPAGEGMCSYHQHSTSSQTNSHFTGRNLAQVHLLAHVHLRAQVQQELENDKRRQVWLFLARQSWSSTWRSQ